MLDFLIDVLFYGFICLVAFFTVAFILGLILGLLQLIIGKKIFDFEKFIEKKYYSWIVLFIFCFLLSLPFIQDYYHYIAKSNGTKLLNDPYGLFFPAYDFFVKHQINYKDGLKNGEASIEQNDIKFVYNYNNNLVDGPFKETGTNYVLTGNFYLGEIVGKTITIYDDGTKKEEITPKSGNRFWGRSGSSFVITYYPDGTKIINTRKYGFWGSKLEGPYFYFSNDKSIEVSNFNYSSWNEYSYSDGPYLIINPDESIEAGEYDNIEGIKDQKYIKEYKNGDIEMGQYENDIKIDSKIIDNK
tara:strand:- start:586 stop:1485 length:900 start_codon:yes stop_codon:yes gene_type:complete